MIQLYRVNHCKDKTSSWKKINYKLSLNLRPKFIFETGLQMVNISSKPVYYFYLIYVTFCIVSSWWLTNQTKCVSPSQSTDYKTFSDSLKNIYSPPVIKFFSTGRFYNLLNGRRHAHSKLQSTHRSNITVFLTQELSNNHGKILESNALWFNRSKRI